MCSGMLTNPVSRSEHTRLHSRKFVIVRKCLFLATNSKTRPLAETMSIPRAMGGMSSLALKLTVSCRLLVLFGTVPEVTGTSVLVPLYVEPRDISHHLTIDVEGKGK